MSAIHKDWKSHVGLDPPARSLVHLTTLLVGDRRIWATLGTADLDGRPGELGGHVLVDAGVDGWSGRVDGKRGVAGRIERTGGGRRR